MDGDVVGPCRQLPTYPVHDLPVIAPRYQRVEEAVAPSAFKLGG